MSLQKPTVLLLPGLMCDAEVWRAQVAALCAAGHKVHVPDFHGLDSLTEMGRAALALAEGPVAVAGHSMGARVALEAFALAPERIERIALVDTGAHPVAPGEAERRQELLDIADREGIEGVIRAWLPPMVAPDRLHDEALMQDIAAMLRRAGVDVLRRQIAALLNRPDGFERIARLRCPAVFIVGRQDAWSPPSQHEEMRALAPHGSLVVIEDCGHMSPVERPEAISEALLQWLNP